MTSRGKLGSRQTSPRVRSRLSAGRSRKGIDLLRLQHDLVILGRGARGRHAASRTLRARPRSANCSLRGRGKPVFAGSAAALTQRRNPPSLEPVDASLKAYESEVASLRGEGLTRALSTTEIERLFALGFALEQLCENFRSGAAPAELR
jgi:hypothetical protein